MLRIQFGLTKTYNQFHNKRLWKVEEELTNKGFEKEYGKENLNLKKQYII